MSSVEITEEELFSELRRLGEKPSSGLSDLQFRLIQEARLNTKLTWIQIAQFINDKFGTAYTGHSLSCKYYFERGVRQAR